MTLLPCPFCGSDNLGIATGDLQPDDLYEAHVCCENCSATGSNVFWYETEEEAESEAIAAWNRRADQQPTESYNFMLINERKNVCLELGLPVDASFHDISGKIAELRSKP